MRIVSLTYINSAAFDQPMDWINRLYAFTGVLEELAKENTVFSIEQIDYEGECEYKGVQYYFRNYGKGVNRFPFQLHQLVKALKPDIVLVRGLHFPLQVIQLRNVLGKKAFIICEHHADKPSLGWRKMLNRIAGKSVNAFHFASAGHASEWINSGNIAEKNKCREIPVGSTNFSGFDKQQSRQQLQLGNELQFIWTGRLDQNKDPLTVIHAFAKFLLVHSSARLQMIYMEDQLLPEIKEVITNNSLLKQSVYLHGRIPHDQLERWYSAADFYLSASHYEGGSIALIEAMACGCIPIVTAISSSLTATDNGQYGFHFKPGEADDLYDQLIKTQSISLAEVSQKIKDHFNRELSFSAIAKKFMNSYRQQ